ncbi:MAG: protein tyrosine phosphatase family protein [Methylovulum sp.]|nr:protein tyrosine phosphatase family protein [Methylovulum sp.]
MTQNLSRERLSLINTYRAVDDWISASGQPTAAQFHDIAATGHRVVINLALHDDPRYSLPDEAGVVRSVGMAYAHIPVLFTQPTETDLLAFFAALEANHQHKVWLHCAANKRASCFLGLYRAIKQHWQPEQAFALMATIWQADEIWSAFMAAMLAKYRVTASMGAD